MLIQNSLFGEEGIDVETLAHELNLSVPSIRTYIKELDPNMLLICKSGNKKLYDINLDAFLENEKI